MTGESEQAAWMREALADGFSALQRGRLEEASQISQRLLGASPRLAGAHFLVGLIATEMQDRWTAVQAFGSVTKIDPKHGAAWAQLARLFMQAGQPQRADHALSSAIQNADENPVVSDLIGSVYSLLGDQQDALLWFNKAVQADPKRVAFQINRANCQMYLGQLDEAEAGIRRVLEQQPHNPNAHWVLAGLRKASDRQHVDAMQDILARDHYSPQAQAFIYYAIGKELEDLEDWPGAMDAFSKGADARRKGIDFDEAAEIEMYEKLKEVYTREWFDHPLPACDASAPIFVLGQPRTGTTLVERVITAHSAVHSAGELRQFGNAVRRLSNYREKQRFSAALIEGTRALDFKALGEAYMQTSRKLAGDAPHFVDKLPSNFIYLPLILKSLPNAKVVHVRRDPMDACFASFKQLFADAYAHSYDQQEMARHHARYYHLMECWRERFADRFYEVRYEHFVADFDSQAPALIDYLGLPWEEACRAFHKQTTAVTTASSVQVRKPVHSGSIGRWRRYERELEPMKSALQGAGVPVATPEPGQ